MKVLFLHGLEGGPGGRKVQYLRDAGFEVVAPALPKDDFEKSVSIAKEHSGGVDAVIGSSRGGAVALKLGLDKLTILLAPAWRKYGVEPKVNNNAFVFHGENDDVVPLKDSLELTEKNPGSSLIINQDDHRQFEQMPVVVEILKNN